MRISLRQQLVYSFLGLVILALLVGLAIAVQSPEKLIKLSTLEFFEENRRETFPVRVLSPGFFMFWRIGWLVAVFVFFWIFLRFFREAWRTIPASLQKFWGKSIKSFRQEWSRLTRFEKWLAGLTFLLLAGDRIYYIGKFPIHTDEAASYFLFIRQGWFATISFYPIPNNHLLQNLLAVPLDHIFGDTFWVLRFWPFFFSLILLMAGFMLLLKFSDFLVAYAATALFGFASLTLFFSTQGRGYILLVLFSVLALGSLFQALRQRQAVYWLLFSFWSTLGFFTVPVFLYPFAALAVFSAIFIAFCREWKQVLPLITALITTVMAAFLLYVPLLLVSGPDALLNNKYLRALTVAQFSEGLPRFIAETQLELLGLKGVGEPWMFYGLLIAQAALFLGRNLPGVSRFLPRQSGLLLGFSLLINLVVYGLMRIQLVLPPPRVFLFKSFFDLLGAAIVLRFLLKALLRKPQVLLPVLIFILAVFIRIQLIRTEFFLTDYPRPYYTYPALNQQIRESGAKIIYVEEPFYRLFLQYDYARFRLPVQIDAQQGRRFLSYDYLVLLKDNPFPAGVSENLYRPVYEDELVKAYRLK